MFAQDTGRNENPYCPCYKVECEACLRIKRSHDEKWVVDNFINDHNHELLPAHAHFFLVIEAPIKPKNIVLQLCNKLE